MAIRKISSRSLGDSQVDTTDIADGSVDLVKLSATGTKDATTYLRGDNTFSALSTTLAGLDDATVSASDPSPTSNKTPVGHVWINSTSGESYVLTDATTNANVWKNIGDGTGAVELPVIDAFVLAGGGGGGGTDSDAPGGGGAGGYLYSTNITLQAATTYSITVGTGGAGGVGKNYGSDGGDSILSGTGITTLTAIGGGGGGHPEGGAGTGDHGRDGGCGGGAGSGTGSGQPGGSGTAGPPIQGYDGGDSVNSPSKEGGGGGGTAEAGNTDGQRYGGDGISNSITGSPVTYGGGGAGGIFSSSTQAFGGDGGGANTASSTNSNGQNGTDGLGGGGSGAMRSAGGGSWNGGDGGDGVVIIRIPTSSYSGVTVTGSPLVTTDGTDTVVKYTGNGTFVTA